VNYRLSMQSVKERNGKKRLRANLQDFMSRPTRKRRKRLCPSAKIQSGTASVSFARSLTRLCEFSEKTSFILRMSSEFGRLTPTGGYSWQIDLWRYFIRETSSMRSHEHTL